MQLIESRWSYVQGKTENTWLADAESEITAGFDPESAIGSQIMVVGSGDLWIKNTAGKWQKSGSTEVIE